MKLNLGSSDAKGKYKSNDWLNVDLFRFTGVKVISSIDTLPFKDNSFELIQTVHVLEHLTRDKHLPVLKECYRVLQPGGTLFVEVPDFEQVVYLLADAFTRKDKISIHQWRTSCFGKNEKKGMAHMHGFDFEQLYEFAETAGFANIKRLTAEQDMISGHYQQEPVLLIKAVK